MNNPQHREPSGCSPHLLMTGGGMIALLCGGCTAWFVNSGDELSQMGYVFGGAPTLIGAGMFVTGFLMSRRKGPRR